MFAGGILCRGNYALAIVLIYMVKTAEHFWQEVAVGAEVHLCVNSAFLCASAVTAFNVYIYRRDAEERRVTQRRFEVGLLQGRVAVLDTR
jgi:hypothetical protein